MLKINIDNIPYIANEDLLYKLIIALHPTINDIKAAKLVKEEIEKRDDEGEWYSLDNCDIFNNVPVDVLKFLASDCNKEIINEDIDNSEADIKN